MIRTVKLAYETTTEARALIAHWRQSQSVVTRYGYNRVREGHADKTVLDQLRAMPQGSVDAWLTLSGLKRAKTLYRTNPDRSVIFGGKRNFKLRAENKITKEQWKQCRLLPLYYEGHAKSYGEQGGNYRFELDIENDRVLFYPKRNTCFALKLKLGRKSNYRELLQILEFRCTSLRDTPFTVSLTESHIGISWEERDEPLKFNLNPARVLSLDLNPSRIGISVLEKRGEDCHVLHWAVYEYGELTKRTGKASDHPETVHRNNKRRFELSQIAKEIQKVAVHYRCGTVASERLNIANQDHGKGKSFNRAVNNQWTRRGFIVPLLRRLECVGIKHAEVNPAYSSKIGNKLWGWGKQIPDQACAAAEIGRRFLQEDLKQLACKNGGNRRKEERQAGTAAERSKAVSARVDWRTVWNSMSSNKPGDTPRFTVRLLEKTFPEQCLSQSPFHAAQAIVSRLEPARISHGLCLNLLNHL